MVPEADEPENPAGKSPENSPKTPGKDSEPHRLLAWSVRRGTKPDSIELYLEWQPHQELRGVGLNGFVHLEMKVPAAYDLSDRLITNAAVVKNRDE